MGTEKVKKKKSGMNKLMRVQAIFPNSLNLLWCPIKMILFYSNESFLLASFLQEGQQREDGYKIGHSLLNEMLSFEQDVTVISTKDDFCNADKSHNIALGDGGLEESYVTGLMQQIKLLELENAYLKNHATPSQLPR